MNSTYRVETNWILPVEDLELTNLSPLFGTSSCKLEAFTRKDSKTGDLSVYLKSVGNPNNMEWTQSINDIEFNVVDFDGSKLVATKIDFDETTPLTQGVGFADFIKAGVIEDHLVWCEGRKALCLILQFVVTGLEERPKIVKVCTILCIVARTFHVAPFGFAEEARVWERRISISNQSSKPTHAYSCYSHSSQVSQRSEHG